MHVLIIDDDLPLATAICDAIEAGGDEPDFADDTDLALRLCAMNRYDVIVLDSGLPRGGPHRFCQMLSEVTGRQTPVLAIGDAAANSDGAGAGPGPNACLASPVSVNELKARLKTLVAECGDHHAQLSAGDLHMDLEAKCVYCGQVPIQLAPISFRILELLIRAFPGVVTRDQIEKQIWNGNPPESDAALRGHIHRLRQLLERPTARQMIRTVHGVGYQLDAVN